MTPPKFLRGDRKPEPIEIGFKLLLFDRDRVSGSGTIDHVGRNVDPDRFRRH
jgi:hypothetical protein